MPQQNNQLIYMALPRAQWFYAATDLLTSLALVVGVPGRIVAVKGSTIVHDEWEMLEHGALPDPVEQALNSLRERISHLERQLETQNNKPDDIIRSMPGG
jgi:hypothetical protein